MPLLSYQLELIHDTARRSSPSFPNRLLAGAELENVAFALLLDDGL
jgi:hypothetical protein